MTNPSDSKGKPKPNQFDYVTNYETPVASHSLEVPLPSNMCWSPDPEKCPPNYFAIVHADLQVLVKNRWVDVDGAAWADNPVLKIGFVGVTSGPAAAWGISNQRSMETRAAWLNETGGYEIGGTTYDIEIVSFDDQKDPL